MPKEKVPYNRIKAVLAEKHKTNNWLVEKLGVNQSTVSKWCTNQVQPPVEMLYKIARALGVEARVLLVPMDELEENLLSDKASE